MIKKNINIKGLIASLAVGALFLTGIAAAQTGSSLAAGIVVNPKIAVGTNNTIAVILLDASKSSTNVSIPSLTLAGTFYGGAGPATLRNCTISSANAMNVALNTGPNAVSVLDRSTTFKFNTAITVPTGKAAELALQCDVDGTAPIGGSITVGLTPSTVSATNPATGAVIVPIALLDSSGASHTSGTAMLQAANATTTGSSTPGIPNTGAGGSATPNIALLIVTGLIILGGLLYLVRRSA